MARAPDMDIASLFYRGHYQDLIESLERLGTRSKDVRARWDYFAGALAFSGRIVEAESLLAIHAPSASATQRAAADFFLAVGLVRKSSYAEARARIGHLLRGLRRSESTSQRFYALQGLAFYRYFCGRYSVALRYAEAAFAEAFKDEFLYGQVLALDLMGFSACQTGQSRKGFTHLERAQRLALKLGNHDNAQALAILTLRSQLGLSPDAILEDLEAALARATSEETYTRGSLLLELSRQRILRGELARSRALLDECAEDIYRQGNRRQAALLHLRYAHVSHLEGHGAQALALLRSARGNLIAGIDEDALSKLRGLESRILTRAPELSRRKPPTWIDARIQARERGQPFRINRGEDPLGDLLDDAQADFKRALPRIIEARYFGLLPSLLRLKPGSRALVFDLLPKTLCLIDGGEVLWIDRAVHSTLRKMAFALAQGTGGKKDLVEAVWGYDYHPLRHDPLLHATLGRLRKLLGTFGSWVEWDGEGYRLSAGVTVLLPGATKTPDSAHPLESAKARSAGNAPSLVPAQEAAVSAADLKVLNARQIEILRYLKSNRFIGVTDCARLFGTSKITSCRDLTDLVKKRRLVRVGRARASQYCLAPDKN